MKEKFNAIVLQYEKLEEDLNNLLHEEAERGLLDIEPEIALNCDFYVTDKNGLDSAFCGLYNNGEDGDEVVHMPLNGEDAHTIQFKDLDEYTMVEKIDMARYIAKFYEKEKV